MGEFHIKRIVLPSGKTVEIVYYQASGGGDPVMSDVHEIDERRRRFGCAGSSCARAAAATACIPPTGTRWRRCAGSCRCAAPTASGGTVDTYDAEEVERFDDVLNDATDRLIEELDRVTRENMNEAVDRFRAALENDGIVPFDF